MEFGVFRSYSGVPNTRGMLSFVFKKLDNIFKQQNKQFNAVRKMPLVSSATTNDDLVENTLFELHDFLYKAYKKKILVSCNMPKKG